MKIGIENMYDDYLRSIKIEEAILTEEAENYIKSKDYLLKKIELHQHFIENFTNISYKEIHNLDRLISEKSLIHLANIAGLDIQSVRRTINVIVQINKELAKIDKQLTDLEVRKVDFETTKAIFYKFNRLMSDEIVFSGYIFRLGSHLGFIRIKKVDAMYNRDGSLRTKKRINWNESKKKKAEIIARGGTPYKVLERDENRKILLDNGGENWFVYHCNDYDYLWHWNKNRCLVLNSPYYKFKPTIYNNSSTGGKLGNVNKLKQLVTANSPLLSNFHEIILESNNRHGYNGRNVA